MRVFIVEQAALEIIHAIEPDIGQGLRRVVGQSQIGAKMDCRVTRLSHPYLIVP